MSDIQTQTTEPRAERLYDFVRCYRCGTLDRTDFQGRRLKERGYACRRCNATQCVDPKNITDEEMEAYRAGAYDEYKA